LKCSGGRILRQPGGIRGPREKKKRNLIGGEKKKVCGGRGGLAAERFWARVGGIITCQQEKKVTKKGFLYEGGKKLPLKKGEGHQFLEGGRVREGGRGETQQDMKKNQHGGKRREDLLQGDEACHQKKKASRRISKRTSHEGTGNLGRGKRGIQCKRKPNSLSGQREKKVLSERLGTCQRGGKQSDYLTSRNLAFEKIGGGPGTKKKRGGTGHL